MKNTKMCIRAEEKKKGRSNKEDETFVRKNEKIRSTDRSTGKRTTMVNWVIVNLATVRELERSCTTSALTQYMADHSNMMNSFLLFSLIGMHPQKHT